MNKKWEYSNYDEKKVKEIANKFNINELLATILVNRNIINDEEINIIVNNTNKPLDVHLMVKDLEKYIDKYSKFNPTFITKITDMNDNIIYETKTIKTNRRHNNGPQ